jgi:flagellar export protein FliJ
MAYRFVLSPVLKLRETIEERGRQLLEQTQLEIARTIRLLQAIREQQLAEVATRERELATGTSGAHLQVVEGVWGQTRRAQAGLEKSLSELQLRREQQLANYQAAKQEREVLSDLRDRQKEAYELLASRASQRTADDLFLARHQQK